MRMRPEQKQAARAVLIDAAGRLFRREGMAGIGIDGLAKEAGQTSGAVYAHFSSKSELFAAVVDDGIARLLASAVAERAAGGDAVSFARRYLSPEHCRAVDRGCLMPALSADIARADQSTRQAYAEGLEKVAAALALPGPGGHGRARAILALCAGGVLLARAVADAEAAQDILAACRANAAGLARAA
jgi:AcrR family transcriptional regulator